MHTAIIFTIGLMTGSLIMAVILMILAAGKQADQKLGIDPHG